MLPVVSVIIPVYNTEKYLNKCVESVLAQTVQQLQIILVDDGSTDSSSYLCDEWAKKDSRIQVIHKKNEGLGFTRNAGLKAAIGRYISFLDSDDTLDETTYEECIANMEEYHTDVCYFGRKAMNSKGNIFCNPNIPTKLVYQGEEIRADFAKTYFGLLPNEPKEPFIQASACCVLYSREIIEKNSIRFCSEREYLSEDTFFNLDICKKAKGVSILPKYFYNYTYNEKSLTKQYDETKFERNKVFKQKLKEYARDFPKVPHVNERIQYLFIGYSRGFIKTEILQYKKKGIVNTYKKIKKMCGDEEIQSIYRAFPKQLLDKNSKIFVSWVIHRRVILLMIYYGWLQR